MLSVESSAPTRAHTCEQKGHLRIALNANVPGERGNESPSPLQPDPFPPLIGMESERRLSVT
jgi:hypothetical protein